MIGGLFFGRLTFGSSQSIFPARQENEGFKSNSVCEKKKVNYWFHVGLIVVVGFSNTKHKI